MRYRVARDNYNSSYWAVQTWVWYWPFWIEFGAGLLDSEQDAINLINSLKNTR